MKYQGLEDFRHDTIPRIGVLVTNLGTPDAPDKAALRRYLKEFLSDPRVVEIPQFVWQPILRGIILNTRPAKSARAYETVWTEQGSPLLTYSAAITEGIAARLADRVAAPVVVRLAMRYGRPAIGEVIDEMVATGVRQLAVLPLYPQYSASTTGSVFDAVANHLTTLRWVPELNFIGAYFDDPAYLDALAASIRAHREAHGAGDHLVMSFHGIPQKYFESGDPYHCHCQYTGRELAMRLGLADDQWTLSFQSRFGPKQWLQPYTDETLADLAGRGVKRVDVVCPGFAADCLETLEEIAGQNAELFEEAGGEHLSYIPALNADPAHIDMLAALVEQRIAPWLSAPGAQAPKARASAARERALSLGAER